MRYETESTQSSKWVIGIAIIAVVAIALAFGLGALSIQPGTPKEGKSTVSFYSMDGTQVNASRLNLSLYVCDYSAVNEIERDAFVSKFENYDQVILNATFYSGLDFVYEIKKNQTAVLKINNGTYFEDWISLKPVAFSVFLYERPDYVYSSKLFTKINISHYEGTMILSLGKIQNEEVFINNKNCSIPGYIDRFDLGKREYLTLKLDNAINYTTIPLNTTLYSTKLYNGDLYILLRADLSVKNEIDFTIELATIGSPTTYVGYIVDADLSTFRTEFRTYDY